MVKKKMTKTQTTKQEFDITLRPHNITGYLIHGAYSEWLYVSDDEFIAQYKKKPEFNAYSNESLLHYRDTMKKLHKNPNLRVKVVSTLDSVCEGCNLNSDCENKNNERYDLAKENDEKAMRDLPELELGEVYTGHDLRRTKYYRKSLKDRLRAIIMEEGIEAGEMTKNKKPRINKLVDYIMTPKLSDRNYERLPEVPKSVLEQTASACKDAAKLAVERRLTPGFKINLYVPEKKEVLPKRYFRINLYVPEEKGILSRMYNKLKRYYRGK